MAGLERAVKENSTNCCLILGELCQMLKQMSETQKESELKGREVGGGADFDQVEEGRSENGLVDGLAEGKVKSKVLQGHRDSITALAVGGEFLFSSSFDKTIHVWSLQDFCHIEEKPLCISGDSGGGIYVWGTCSPLGQEPLKILYEQKDWRFSGIHALASRNGYIYTGSGDRTVKAWSVQDGTISCTMSGHKSVVSTLAVCDSVLYSGSWDGTIRLWSLSDHSPLAVLGEDTSGTVASVLSLAADRSVLIATHENGCVKVWRNDREGWNKTVNVQEWSSDEFQNRFQDLSDPSPVILSLQLCYAGKECFLLDMLIRISRCFTMVNDHRFGMLLNLPNAC
ncbi:hypothetical protein M0R45_011375 [Rubus argutus]|uniref:Uncharacterized protein n=1 Tax=Rubus argutus TaxID=59490 RepID=A0AAW1YCF9_RUBAR